MIITTRSTLIKQLEKEKHSKLNFKTRTKSLF